MTFTDRERSDWLREKRKREHVPLQVGRTTPAPICLHCSNPFAHGEGVITDDAALCDVCLGD